MGKFCVITCTRAEYGQLRWAMQNIKDDPNPTLQIIATGMHLSPEFGLTCQVIEPDNFQIDRKVEMLTSSGIWYLVRQSASPNRWVWANWVC
jgi:GDP/UDP-N,N'-diacetylbacillosamine 2-epimerase (hydrolysing)